ncbi:ABC transporter permease [Leucobacter sp. M11]|uniref:ABC transporter permease n=1 Tax=Leucobacter sp. M11 TaxID=2993565 RepID=UPI002D80AA1A|nr:ABC transporter permease [Leucobacter sp. M11]MEB4614266.1 ABC transporter permease [Leucobacter sp. M11]
MTQPLHLASRSSRGRKRPWLEPLLLLSPAIVLLMLGFFLPVAQMVFSSVTSFQGESGFSLANYAEVFKSDYYLSAMGRSLKLSLIQTVITLALALPLSYLMTRVSGRISGILMAIIILPLMTSVVVRTFGWVVLLAPNSWLGQMAKSIDPVRYGQGLLGTEAGIVISMVQVLLPFAVLTLFGVMQNIDPKLEEAARTMGAGFLSTLRTVVFPLSLPGLISGATLVFALSVSSFITPRLVGGSRLPVLAGTIYNDATVNLDWPFAAAQSTLLFLAVVMLIFATSRIGSRK